MYMIYSNIEYTPRINTSTHWVFLWSILTNDTGINKKPLRMACSGFLFERKNRPLISSEATGYQRYKEDNDRNKENNFRCVCGTGRYTTKTEDSRNDGYY